MPFVQRNKKGEITGLWTVRQWEGQEELSDDNPEVVAFKERQPPLPKDFLVVGQFAFSSLASPNTRRLIWTQYNVRNA